MGGGVISSTVGGAAVLALLAVAVGVAHSRLVPIRLTLESPPGAGERVSAPTPKREGGLAGGNAIAKSSPMGATASSSDGMIHLARVMELHEQMSASGGVVFIDARGPEEFATGHIPGAINVPPDAFFGGHLPEALDQIAKSDAVVVYCGGGACDASKLVAIRFREAGFGSVFVYEEGFTEWSALHKPTSEGP